MIYNLIKAIPAKGINWAEFNAELLRQLFDARRNKTHLMYGLGEWCRAKGVRQMRQAAVEIAVQLADEKSVHVYHEQPSEETLAWGGFLSSTTHVYNRADEREAAIEGIKALIAQFQAA